jgi:hypothetical protein
LGSGAVLVAGIAAYALTGGSSEQASPEHAQANLDKERIAVATHRYDVQSVNKIEPAPVDPHVPGAMSGNPPREGVKIEVSTVPNAATQAIMQHYSKTYGEGSVDWYPDVTGRGERRDQANGLPGIPGTVTVGRSGDVSSITVYPYQRDKVGTEIAVYIRGEAMTTQGDQLTETAGYEYVTTVKKEEQGWAFDPESSPQPDESYTNTDTLIPIKPVPVETAADH